MRSTVVAVAGGAAIFQAGADRRVLVVGVVAGLGLWSVLYARFHDRRALVPADTLVMVSLCLAQRWLVPPDALGDSTNWVFAVACVTALGHQWLTTASGGMALTGAIVAAHVIGSMTAAPEVGAGPALLALWTVAEAGLSRLLYVLVVSAARQADRARASGEQARRRAAIASARRAEEREHLATLHDTAAATLLAAGLRMVDGDEPWLAERAARDLEILTTRPEPSQGETDLVRLLEQVVRHAPVSVDVRAPTAVPMPAARAAAMSAAVREALTNVGRHAGVHTAELLVEQANDVITVRVTDRGRGFAPERIPPDRRGVSHSIEQRMAWVGGQATVESRPGAGTQVRLEAPRA
ncbi:ATP-binding protein [Spongiactinospora sp. TRM90649]|uniref:sensor histidine kinase n=1 Tax=Spongiactinospora sp. TRM90649 TaxID=3031114 RepID=UPI0023F7AEFA|nr:ATP-binding protein [Spongiactinospora sp. TRM90649]MDF5755092.1 ATP-binding protein [Spongiactinospora sp. TRM90649]